VRRHETWPKSQLSRHCGRATVLAAAPRSASSSRRASRGVTAVERVDSSRPAWLSSQRSPSPARRHGPTIRRLRHRRRRNPLRRRTRRRSRVWFARNHIALRRRPLLRRSTRRPPPRRSRRLQLRRLPLRLRPRRARRRQPHPQPSRSRRHVNRYPRSYDGALRSGRRGPAGSSSAPSRPRSSFLRRGTSGRKCL
jgi:hypothetical protein